MSAAGYIGDSGFLPKLIQCFFSLISIFVFRVSKFRRKEGGCFYFLIKDVQGKGVVSDFLIDGQSLFFWKILLSFFSALVSEKRFYVVNFYSDEVSSSAFGQASRRILPRHDNILQCVRGSHISSAGSIVLFVESNNKSLVFRLGFSETANSRLKLQREAQDFLWELDFGLIPKVVDFMVINDGVSLVEEKVVGRGGRSQADDEGFWWEFEQANYALDKLHLINSSLKEMDFDEVFGYKFDLIERFLDDSDDLDKLHRLRGEAESFYSGSMMHTSFVHGDFKVDNCIYGVEGISGIVDWDLFSYEDLSLLDRLNMAFNPLGRSKGYGLGGLYALDYEVLVSSKYSRLVDFIPEQFHGDSLKYAVIAHWIDRVYKQFKYAQTPDEAWVDENVIRFLNGFVSKKATL